MLSSRVPLLTNRSPRGNGGPAVITLARQSTCTGPTGPTGPYGPDGPYGPTDRLCATPAGGYSSARWAVPLDIDEPVASLDNVGLIVGWCLHRNPNINHSVTSQLLLIRFPLATDNLAGFSSG